MWKQFAPPPPVTTKDIVSESIKGMTSTNISTKIQNSLKSFENNSNLYYQYLQSCHPLSGLENDPNFFPYLCSDQDIEDLYTSGLQGRTAGKKIYKQIINSRFESGNRCPYCSKTLAVGEVEHFLPKSTYKKFSVEAWNLFPVCKECNWHKRAKFSNIVNMEFINPHALPTLGEWLSLDITQIPNSPIPKLEYKIIIKNLTSDPVLNDRLVNQINELKLLNYFTREAINRIPIIKEQLSCRNNALERLQFLEMEALIHFKNFPNNWEGVLYREISKTAWIQQNHYTF